MTVQTSYDINQPKAYAGQLFGLAPKDVVSRAAEGAISFGVAVGMGTDEQKQVAAGIGTGFVGISLRSLEREGAIYTGNIAYADKETVGIIRSGYVWAVCPSGCNPGDPVNFVNATGVLDSGAAVAGETLLDDAIWDSTASAGELAVIRLDGLNTTAGS